MTLLSNLNPNDDFVYGLESRYIPRNKTGLPYQPADDGKWNLGSAPQGTFATATANSYVTAPLTLAMTSNNTPAGYVASASAEFNASYQAWKGFDGVRGGDASIWVNSPAGLTSGWLRVQLPLADTFNGYTIHARVDIVGYRHPTSWTFEGSNNGIAWVVLDTRANETGWTLGESRSFYMNNNTSYLYYRINISASIPYAPNDHLEIAELSFYKRVTSPITFTALTRGTIGNSISLVFNGAQSTATVCNAWNAANPTNQVAYTGSGADIMVAGTVNLTGGSTVATFDATIPPSAMTSNITGIYITSASKNSGEAWKAFDYSSVDSTDISPLMTSNNTPVGYAALASSQYNADYQAWMAFNRSTLYQFNCWITLINVTTGWLQIKFPSAVSVKSYRLSSPNDTTQLNGAPMNWTFEGSPDGAAWTVLDTRTNQTDWKFTETRYFDVVGGGTPYAYYRVNITANNGYSAFVRIAEWALYATSIWGTAPYGFTPGDYVQISGQRVSRVKTYTLTKGNRLINVTPRMVSASQPIGYTVTHGGEYSATYAAWKAFSGTNLNDQDSWISTNGVTTGYLQLQFPSAVAVSMYSISARNYTTIDYKTPRDWTLQGSNNGTAWTIIDTRTNQTPWESGQTREYSFVNTTTYTHYRLNITVSAGGAAAYTCVGELVFYADPGGMPTDWVLQGSPDEAVWTPLHSRTGEAWSATALGAPKTYTVTTVPETHKHFRISVNNTEQLPVPLIPQPRLVSYTSMPGYEVSVSSFLAGENYYWGAFNGVLNEVTPRWITNTGQPTGWIQLKFPRAVVVKKYLISGNNEAGWTPRSPRNWTLQGSNDNAAWTILDTQVNQVGWVVGEARSFNIANVTAYLYYRVNVTLNNGDANYVAINEINFYYVPPQELIIPELRLGALPPEPVIYESAGKWLNIHSNFFRGEMFQARWADVAEKFDTDEDLPPGSVVVLGGPKEITLSGKEYDTDVLGIISTDPAVIMNQGSRGGAVALMGQVPCLVIGSAKKGDFLVTSHVPGVAKAIPVGHAKSISYFCLLGRVLEDKVSEDIGFCKVLAGKP